MSYPVPLLIHTHTPAIPLPTHHYFNVNKEKSYFVLNRSWKLHWISIKTMIITKLTWRYWSKWDNIISAAFKVLSIFSWAFLIEWVLICNTIKYPNEKRSKIQKPQTQIHKTPFRSPKFHCNMTKSKTSQLNKNPNLKIEFWNKKKDEN
jgi:hypothetical protein